MEHLLMEHRNRMEHTAHMEGVPAKASSPLCLTRMEHRNTWNTTFEEREEMTWLDSLLMEPVPCPSGSHNGYSPRGLSLEDAAFLREERAAILEYEAGMDRAQAERLAGVTR